MRAESGNKVLRGVICAALGGICWGFSGTCAQLLVGMWGIPVMWVTCVRLLGAAVLFIGIALVRDRSALFAAARDVRSLGVILAFALFGVLLTQMSYLSAIGYTDAGTGTMLERLGLLVILGYVCVTTPRAPHAREALGLVMALAGVAIIATKGDFTQISLPVQGLAWGLVSAVALACYTLIPTGVLKKWGAIVVTGYAMLFGGVVATVFVQPWNMGVQVTPEVAGVMLAIVIVGTLGAYTLFLQGVNDAGPVRAGLVGSIEPVSATVISAVWLGTSITVWDVVGCALIVGMVFLVTQRDDGSTEDEMLPVFQGRASLVGWYRSRRAVPADVPALWALLDQGHAAMAELGIHEGAKRYPSQRRLRRSIDHGSTYVVEDDEGVPIGMFALTFQGDPNYRKPLSGAWRLSDAQPADHAGEGTDGYAALHWVTVAPQARRSGVGRFMLGEADRIARAGGAVSIRADVYRDNHPMRMLLEGYGFADCGIIELRNTFGQLSTRAVYERCL